MKISLMKYSEVSNSIKKRNLLLSFQDNDNNENQLFKKKPVENGNKIKQNKFKVKGRILSASHKQTQKLIENDSPTFTPIQRSSTSRSVRTTHNPSSDIRKLKSRPRTATNRFYTSFQQKNNVKRDIFQQLSKQIKQYFSSIFTKEQKKSTIQELKLILNILQKQNDPSTIFSQLQKLQDYLSKFLKHRISHLYFYLIYYKFYSSLYSNSLEKQIKLLSLAEYHARSFNFRRVALLICLQIQQKHIKMNNFEESRVYAIKSLKLAVLTDDRYEEQKMLEYIGVLRYYEGILNSRGNNVLSQKQRLNILRHYKQQQQIPKIFSFLDKNTSRHNDTKKTKTYKQNFVNENYLAQLVANNERVYFNQGQNFIKKMIPDQNLKKFKLNFHDINKKITRAHAVKESIKKISKVGEVKKYIGKDNFITLHPQQNTIRGNHQIQVLVTHKKYGEMDKSRPFFRKQLPTIINHLSLLVMQESIKFQFGDEKNKNQK